MKVERWEEESDEDWTERLAEEIELANATETTQYFVERDPYDEEKFIINYIGKTGWTWKEHPEGPFSCKQVLEWKLKAERKKMNIEISDELYEYLKDLRHADGAEAWYTAQIKLDLDDMDATIKDIIVSRDMWMAVEDGKLTSNKTYPWNNQSSDTTAKVKNDE